MGGTIPALGPARPLSTGPHVQKLWQDIKNILTAPLAGEVDTVQIWALVGVVLISLVVWGFILRHIRLAASEL